MTELLSFKGKENTFNVVEHVGAKFTELGVILLNDETGVIVEALRKEYLLNADEINNAIFSKCMATRGESTARSLVNTDRCFEEDRPVHTGW